MELKCEKEGCEETLKNNKWEKIKADGWFQMRDGTVYCPKHVPAWVANWRKNRVEKA